MILVISRTGRKRNRIVSLVVTRASTCTLGNRHKVAVIRILSWRYDIRRNHLLSGLLLKITWSFSNEKKTAVVVRSNALKRSLIIVNHDGLSVSSSAMCTWFRSGISQIYLHPLLAARSVHKQQHADYSLKNRFVCDQWKIVSVAVSLQVFKDFCREMLWSL